MSLATAYLPYDPAALRAFASARQAELKAAQLSIQLRSLEIEKLKFEMARPRRVQFGRSSERITRRIEQFELRLEELEIGHAEEVGRHRSQNAQSPSASRCRTICRAQEVVHEPEGGACVCPACGAGMAKLGEDVTEVLDYVLGSLPGHSPCAAEVRLQGLRCDYSGACASHADAARASAVFRPAHWIMYRRDLSTNP